jgi:hypothetical protein
MRDRLRRLGRVTILNASRHFLSVNLRLRAASFFYYGNTALAHYMSAAMRAAGVVGDGDFLDRFKAYGWYLDDLVLESPSTT